MKKVIFLLCVATLLLSMKQEEPKTAVITQDSVKVYAETPKVNFKMQHMGSEYDYAEVVDTLFIGDTVVVNELREGIDYDTWAKIYYARYDTIIKKKDCCSREMDTITILRVDEGWIYESWHKINFLEYIEIKQRLISRDDRDGVE